MGIAKPLGAPMTFSGDEIAAADGQRRAHSDSKAPVQHYRFARAQFVSIQLQPLPNSLIPFFFCMSGNEREVL